MIINAQAIYLFFGSGAWNGPEGKQERYECNIPPLNDALTSITVML